MDSALLFNDADVDIAKGRYIVIGKGGKAVAQSDDFDTLMDEARALGIETPAVVDLEIARDYIHVY